MAYQPEPCAMHDQPMLAIDIEALISNEAFLAPQPLVYHRRNLREVRQDEGLDVEGLSFELEVFNRPCQGRGVVS